MKIRNHIEAMERAGFRYHAFGTLKQGRKTMAHWYRGDALSPEQLATIQSIVPGAMSGKSSCQYAPEITHPVVIFPRQSNP